MNLSAMTVTFLSFVTGGLTHQALHFYHYKHDVWIED